MTKPLLGVVRISRISRERFFTRQFGELEISGIRPVVEIVFVHWSVFNRRTKSKGGDSVHFLRTVFENLETNLVLRCGNIL